MARLLYVMTSHIPPDNVLFAPQVKTMILLNVKYYGWIKSLARSLAGISLKMSIVSGQCTGTCLEVPLR
jgi:hypothetical protein